MQPLKHKTDLQRNSNNLDGTRGGDFRQGCFAGLGDRSGLIIHGNGFALGANARNVVRNLFGAYWRNMESSGWWWNI